MKIKLGHIQAVCVLEGFGNDNAFFQKSVDTSR